MSIPAYSDDELLAYVDEQLSVERMTQIEAELRRSEPLRLRAASLCRRRDQNLHTVGEIWRRGRLSCATRAELAGFHLGTLDRSTAEYIEFHLHSVGCRLCAANLDDLRTAMPASPETSGRRQRYFESSAGKLRSR